MNSLVPSRRLLRQLAFACRESARTSASRPQIRKICHTRQRKSISSRPTSQQAPFITGRRLVASRQVSISNETPTSITTTSTAAAPAQESIKTSTSNPLPDISNHYTLFPSTLPHGPPPHGPFSIALAALRKEFLQVQSLYHPDKHPYEPAHSKARALSALINDAYKTLSYPLLRAQYLLQQNYGIDVTSEDNSTHASDAETLM